MYNEIYNIIMQYIYGDVGEITPYIELVCTALATMGVVFMIVLPFVIVYWFIKALTEI